ncbi:MAG: methylglyoxal synthase [Natronomonas sp.]
MRIALIAHDKKKSALIEFATEHTAELEEHDLIATGTTGGRLNDGTELEVTPLLSGPLGGDMMIGSEVATGDCSAIIFFRDPLTAQPHEPDVSALLCTCDIHDVPLATNRASAETLVEGFSGSD